jgi:L-serine dehydratase
MKILSIRDIIGPVMIGPSSSHTAGALRIALMARRLISAEPEHVTFTLYGSFAHTYAGHGTDRALVAGVLGLEPDDARIKNSFELARTRGMSFEFEIEPDVHVAHPNTLDILVRDARGVTTRVRGESIGGGAAQIVGINGVEVQLTGQYHSLVVKQRDVHGVLAFIAQSLSNLGVNIATTKLFREKKGQIAYTIMETDDAIPAGIIETLVSHTNIFEARIIPSDRSSEALAPKVNAAQNGEAQTGEFGQGLSATAASELFEKYNFESAHELLEICRAHGLSISEAMCRRERTMLVMNNISFDDTKNYLNDVLGVMQRSILGALEAPARSMGGLIGGEGARVDKCSIDVAGGALKSAIAYSMAVLETNASMGCIVAAPTAGSSGVLPGVIFALKQSHAFSDAQLVHALSNAAAIGYIISKNATVSGAEGGCQAEVGSASAMAASAACELLGGTPEMCVSAAASALGGLLGLVCDPIAGLVEAPCQARNATGAANALACAQMALAGASSVVPFDEVVDAMYHVGKSLPFELRESALGGMAATPTACSLCKKAPTTGSRGFSRR